MAPDAEQPSGFDSNGFAAFYREFAPRLRRYFRNLGVGDADGDDFTHDTLLRVWDRREVVDPARASAYVFAAARNTVRSWWRDTRRTVLVDDDVLAAQLDDADGPEAAGLRGHERVALGAALRSLSEADRRLLVDSDVHGETSTVLGRHYGMSGNAVRVWRIRARRRLAAAVGSRVAPVLLVPAAWCRLVSAARHHGRTGSEPSAALLSWPQPLTVMLTALTMIAAPSPGPLVTAAPRGGDGSAAEVLLRPSLVAIGPASVRAAAGWSAARGAATRAAGADEDEDETRPVRKRLAVSPLPGGGTPAVCVEGKCPAGTSADQDVFTVHAPAPIGDTSVGTDAAPVCRTAPDTPWTSCHTGRNPDYRSGARAAWLTGRVR